MSIMERLTNREIVYQIMNELINNSTSHEQFVQDILNESPHIKRESINNIINAHNLPIEQDDSSYDDLFTINLHLNASIDNIMNEKVRTEEEWGEYADDGGKVTSLILSYSYFEADYDVNELYDYLSQHPNVIFFERFLEDYVNDKTVIADYFNQKVSDESFRQYVLEQAEHEEIGDIESLKSKGLTLIPFKVLTVNIKTTHTDIANRYVNHIHGKNVNDFIDAELNDLLFEEGSLEPVIEFYDTDADTIPNIQSNLIESIDDLKNGSGNADAIDLINRTIDTNATIRTMMRESAIEDFHYDEEFATSRLSKDLQCEATAFYITAPTDEIVNKYVKSALGYSNTNEFSSVKLVEMLIDNNEAQVLFICHLDPSETVGVSDSDDEQEVNPSVSYMIQRIYDVYDENEMIKEIEESRYGLLDKVKEVARQEGIEIENLEQVDYQITNVNFTTPIGAIADVMVEDIRELETTVSSYLKWNLYDTLITEIDYDVELKTDKEDVQDDAMNREVDEGDLEENPTIEYMVTRIDDMYDENTMKEIIQESRYGLIDKIKEQLDEIGIDYAHVNEVRYEFKNFRITTDIEALAEVFVQEVKEFGMTVTHYLKTYLYDNLITEVDYDINVLDDAEDF